MMPMQELNIFAAHWLPKLEAEMGEALSNGEAALATHCGMMHYHLGWVDPQFRQQLCPSGKRLRPLLCLLACIAVSGDPEQALPAAAAIELLHNFSLIHDDIQDGDKLRRHRPTVWKIWGIAQAINVGDGMFALAFAALHRLPQRGVDAEITLRALYLLTQAAKDLTEGQYLDMSFEQRSTVNVSEYLRMIQGKTAALVGASVRIGALVGGARLEQQEAFQCFGQSLGLAFQIQDDILGIWGNTSETGKPAGNDILRRKKSLPILYTLNHPTVGEQFAALLEQPLEPTELPSALALLEKAAARDYAEAIMQRQHTASLAALEQALCSRADRSVLANLANGLLTRRM